MSQSQHQNLSHLSKGELKRLMNVHMSQAKMAASQLAQRYLSEGNKDATTVTTVIISMQKDSLDYLENLP